jgi:predicted DNA binding CopG/RHH family protein
MKKQKFLDEEEKSIVEAYAHGEFKPVKAQKKLKSEALAAARSYVRKDARINIRLSTTDLTMLKRRAIEEGLPYQSLIASILHKYVSGYDAKHFE